MLGLGLNYSRMENPIMKNPPALSDLCRLSANLADLKKAVEAAQSEVKDLLFNMKDNEKLERELWSLNENDPEDAAEIANIKEKIEANKWQINEYMNGDKHNLPFGSTLLMLSEFHGIEDIVLDALKNGKAAK